MHEQIENNKKLEEERDRAQQAQIQAAKELAAKSAEACCCLLQCLLSFLRMVNAASCSCNNVQQVKNRVRLL